MRRRWFPPRARVRASPSPGRRRLGTVRPWELRRQAPRTTARRRLGLQRRRATSPPWAVRSQSPARPSSPPLPQPPVRRAAARRRPLRHLAGWSAQPRPRGRATAVTTPACERLVICAARRGRSASGRRGRKRRWAQGRGRPCPPTSAPCLSSSGQRASAPGERLHPPPRALCLQWREPPARALQKPLQVRRGRGRKGADLRRALHGRVDSLSPNSPDTSPLHISPIRPTAILPFT